MDQHLAGKPLSKELVGVFHVLDAKAVGGELAHLVGMLPDVLKVFLHFRDWEIPGVYQGEVL